MYRYFDAFEDYGILEVRYETRLPDAFISKLQVRLRHSTIPGGSWRYGCCLNMDNSELSVSSEGSTMGSRSSMQEPSSTGSGESSDERNVLSKPSFFRLSNDEESVESRSSRGSPERLTEWSLLKNGLSGPFMMSFGIVCQHDRSIYVLTGGASPALQAVVVNELVTLHPSKERYPPWEEAVIHYRLGSYTYSDLVALFHNNIRSQSFPPAASATSSRRTGKRGRGREKRGGGGHGGESYLKSALAQLSAHYSNNLSLAMHIDDLKKNLRMRLTRTCLEKIFGLHWVRRVIYFCS